jgi:hypothetical protein
VWGWHERQIREYAGSSIGFNVHRELGNGETRPETPNKCENWSSEWSVVGQTDGNRETRCTWGPLAHRLDRLRLQRGGPGTEGPDVYLSQI